MSLFQYRKFEHEGQVRDICCKGSNVICYQSPLFIIVTLIEKIQYT